MSRSSFNPAIRRGLEPVAAGMRRLAEDLKAGNSCFVGRFEAEHRNLIKRVIEYGTRHATEPDAALRRIEENIAQRRASPYAAPEDLAALDALEAAIRDDREAVLAMLAAAIR